jgi:hypothetical protein
VKTMVFDWSSILQLVMAAVSAFTQVWGVIHGQPIDSTHAAVAVGLAASGLGHAKSTNGR